MLVEVEGLGWGSKRRDSSIDDLCCIIMDCMICKGLWQDTDSMM